MGHDGPSISESSGLPERTVRHAVRWLVDEGLVRRLPDLQDTRRAVLVPMEIEPFGSVTQGTVAVEVAA